MVDIGCEAVIGGETDNYGIRFAVESGIELIETSHEISENKGLELFTAMLQKEFPEIKIDFYENKIPYTIV